MIHPYKGNYIYNWSTISNWNNRQIGVYYCGSVLQDGSLLPMYIGKGTGENGIKGRLLQHINSDTWQGVTHFGYCSTDNSKEADNFELSEIARYKPKYNTQGKSSLLS